MHTENLIYPNKLVSPVNGYECRKITKQNIRQFGFETIGDLHKLYPEFPTICSDLNAIYVETRLRASKISGEIQARNACIRRGERYCQYCQVLLTNRDQKKFCSKSCAAKVNNKALNTEGQKETILKTFYQRYTINPSLCGICNNVLPYDKRHRNYCEDEKCISENKQSLRPLPICKYKNRTKPRRCVCGTDIEILRNRKCISCSKKKPTGPRYCICGDHLPNLTLKYCGKCKTNSRHYRGLCSFNFNVYHYPNDFDLSLIEKYGWYSPNGRGKAKMVNLGGVSRDHLYNVSDGFRNNRDPKVLGHPANCDLKVHNGIGGNNSYKYSRITWEELLERVKLWDSTH